MLKVQLANKQHEVTYQELNDLLKKHSASLSPLEVLAIASNMVGKLIALQDQRTVTHAMVMSLVANNIEHGNRQVVAELLSGPQPGPKH